MSAGESEAPAAAVRSLLRAVDRATLATALARDGTGWPYASLVLVATDYDATPLLLISDLADHARNISADARASLLFDGTRGYSEPLAGPRATILGHAERRDDPRQRARFLARHPSAAQYASFADFHLYRLSLDRAHLVAGFGKIHWLEGGTVRLDAGSFQSLAAAESEIVMHMNKDHQAAIDLIARHVLRLRASGWRMTGVDPEGCDFRMAARVARLPFERQATTPDDVRRELVRLTNKGRRLGGVNDG